nr:hypothetical protein L203_00171 [Cryptococcus depauperatus CBS 7841]
MVSKLFAATVVLAAPVESEIEKRATTYSKRLVFSRSFLIVDTNVNIVPLSILSLVDLVLVARKTPMMSSSLSSTDLSTRKVVITNKQNGRIVTAKVVNECPECNEGSLDMSPSLFGQLNDNGYNEEVFPITWYWKSD